MSRASSSKVNELIQCVSPAMPGWTFLTPPEGFGWAPDKHFRAQLIKGKQTAAVVVRQSWSAEVHQVELFLYRSVLPDIAIRTPKLWGTFELHHDAARWMVLEDIGKTQARHDHVEDRKAFLHTLGCLHGQGICLVHTNHLLGSPLPRFSRNCDEHDQWRTPLEGGLLSPSYGLGEWMVSFLGNLWLRLGEETVTLLHGDANFSNAILTDEGVALVDWEKAMIGPPSLDLGLLMEVVESTSELEIYRHAFCQTARRELSLAQLRDWADLADGYNCLRWICYYIKGTSKGKGPGPEWRQNYYDPCLRRLRLLYERRGLMFDEHLKVGTA